MHTLAILSFSSVALVACVNGANPPPCDSEIYCTGPILHQVQKAKLFDDDKYFVDMKLRETPDVVLSAFRNLSSASPDSTVPPSKLQEFISTYFEKPGTEFEPWTPPDWHDKPKFLGGIADGELRTWAEKIHHLWKSLGRKMVSGVKDHPELYSQIYSPHPVVVPGGRFRELYYWDSYWVINGLLLSEMTDTAHGMIQNFLDLVNRYGFIPNGGRIYYERRSQPPFLTAMVESYYQATKDKEFLRAALPSLEQEYRFWMQNRSVAVEVNGTEHVLNRYHVQVGLPRPESYTDDLELAEGLTDDRKEQLWMDLKAGAESGWDFTSRWYMDGDGHKNGTLRETRTSQILPADLNALLCLNEKTLASFHRILGDLDAAALYEQTAARRLEAIESVLWDAERGSWFDYNLVTDSKHFEFYPSNLAPVWAQCYSRPEMAEKAVQYLKGSGALQFPNGVPTSLGDSGQQWDYPNAWPPLQHMLIHGLSKLPSEDARELAFDLAQRWIKTNWLAYMKYEAMFEKYDVNGDGKPGGGGEYQVQLGFGWTNGVALQLLDQYGPRLVSGSSRVSPGLLLPLVLSAALRLQ
ncbi:trehalase [Etheostoma spectabile]|uniref:trehalase n=1 Tax=Etheostoma spectabile TaxID=54343 RepID=UPI0013AF106E|nr:trehalase [Etheostoma spectabile]